MIGVLAVSACLADAAQVPQDAASTHTSSAHTEDHPPVHIDSIFPIEESLRRFRTTSGPEPGGLAGGAPTRDALVARFVDALAVSDTAALVDMLLTREEFAWLYYPHTRYAKRPYELAPEILWMQFQNGSSRGLGRLLDRLGGTRMVGLEHRCDGAPLIEGPNRTWERCTLRIDPPQGEPAHISLFGSILERDGIFKFVSYSNDF
jgi:hypothetical protein